MKLEFIQCLRGIAALMVVFFHFSEFIEPAIPGSVAFFSHGRLGVDIFFVISGFIIYLSTEQDAARNGAVFLARRLCRVVLPAWAAMFLSVLVMPPYFRDLVMGLFFIPLQNTIPPTFGYSFLIVAWTLTYELVFYGVFALVLCTKTGRKHRGLTSAGALFGLVAVIQTLTYTFTLDAQNGPVVQLNAGYFPVQLISLLGNPILFEFVVGIIFGWAYLAGFFNRISPIAATVTGALIIFLVLKFQFRPGHGLSCGGLLATVLVMYVLAMQAEWDRIQQAGTTQKVWKWLAVPVILLGDISYSMYLVHPSVKSLLNKTISGGNQLSIITNWNFPIALAATLVLSIFFYRWIELPAQRFGRFVASRAVAINNSRHFPLSTEN
jgi:exopolysaccharide production protein ExoZ